jgi:hypothetical protein
MRAPVLERVGQSERLYPLVDYHGALERTEVHASVLTCTQVHPANTQRNSAPSGESAELTADP